MRELSHTVRSPGRSRLLGDDLPHDEVADELDVDLEAAVEAKNAVKYPVEQVCGSARKREEP